MDKYERTINYIGSSASQKKFTRHIHRKYGRINFISYIHDNMYKIILQVENVYLFIILKLLVDLMFLICGVFLNVFRFNVYKGIQGIIITILAYIGILIYTPVYTYKHYKQTKKIRWF